MTNENRNAKVHIGIGNEEEQSNTLAGKQFFIPAYQRGYRWEELQVSNLLEDLDSAFFADSPTDYELQMLTVCKGEGEALGSWCVIDGQQRLTTIFLILKAIEELESSSYIWKKPYCIEYETRKSGECEDQKLDLDDVVSRIRDNSKSLYDTPDEYFLMKSYQKAKTWLSMRQKRKGYLKEFCEKLLNNAHFIWYSIAPELAGQVFAHMNFGKIPLCNAEIIKAQLLSRYVSADFRKLEAYKWEQMEQVLRNDEIFAFICPRINSPHYDASRMEYLFDLWYHIRKGDIEKLYKQNPGLFGEGFDFPLCCKIIEQHRFYALSDLVSRVEDAKKKQEKEEKCDQKFLVDVPDVWGDVKTFFAYLTSWYYSDHLHYYHLIGFLMNTRGKTESAKLSDLSKILTLIEAGTTSRAKLLCSIKRACRDVLFGKENFKSEEESALTIAQAFDLASSTWQYHVNDSQLTNLLLFYNIALLYDENREQERFPFNRYQNQEWQLEHIRAQKAEAKISKEEREEQARWVSMVAKTKNGQDVPPKIALEDVIIPESQMNFLGNMALLWSKINNRFKNSNLEQKRRILYANELHEDYDGEKKDMGYIPVGTRWIYFKHYQPFNDGSDPGRILLSKNTKDEVMGGHYIPFEWTQKDSQAYVSVIKQTVCRILKDIDTL